MISVLTLLAVFCFAGTPSRAENDEPTEADITRATASLLENSQFARRRLDDSLCSQFLDCYLDTLDGERVLFFKSDLDEFSRFRLSAAREAFLEGETQPAHIIYGCYLKRLAQQTDFSLQLLHFDKFDLTGHDSWQADRRGASRPFDLTAAQALWREEVREDYLQEKLAGTPAAKIAPALARRYERRLIATKRLKPNEVLAIYLDALAHAYDPHSDYFGHPEEGNFKAEINSSLVGIGGSLQVKGGLCIISDLVPGGPAASSGLLKAGDRIVAVAQEGSEPVDIKGMSSSQVADLIRGPKGSIVRITIIPAGAHGSIRKTVSLVRDEIKFAEARAKASIIDLPQIGAPALRIGVIDLPLFYARGEEKTGGASADTARLIKKLKEEGAAGLILDLRGNGGGSLTEAIRLTGLFIPAGPVLQILNSQDDVELGVSPETNALYNGPLIVLTSRSSASASEIVAGALQDYGRAVIVGDSSTYGKGTVQDVVPLKEFFHRRGLGSVHLTVAKFYRPSGTSTQIKGVVPDIILPSETDLPDVGESQLPNALPWDTLPPVTYKKFDLVRPALAGLLEKSHVRINANPGFRMIREDLAMEEKGEEAKSLSLNEAERQGEKARTEGIRAKMNEMLLTDAARTQAAYVTLWEADSQGLSAARQAMRTVAVVAKTAAVNPDEEIELREVENILADYIRALATPVNVLGAVRAPEIASSQAAQAICK